MPSDAIHIPNLQNKSPLSESFDDLQRGNTTWSTLISASIGNTDSLCAGIIACPPNGGELALHSHSEAEIYFVLAGSGDVRVQDKTFHVAAGSMLYIPGNAVHGVKNMGETEMRWLYFFPTSDFDSIVYHFMDSGKAIAGNL